MTRTPTELSSRAKDSGGHCFYFGSFQPMVEWKMSVGSSSLKWPFIISLFFGACILSAINDHKSANHSMLRHQDEHARHTRIASLAEASVATAAAHAARVGE